MNYRLRSLGFLVPVGLLIVSSFVVNQRSLTQTASTIQHNIDYDQEGRIATESAEEHTVIDDESTGDSTDPTKQVRQKVEDEESAIQQHVLSFETSLAKLPKLRKNPQRTKRNPIDTSLSKTVAGVDVSSRDLYSVVDLKGNSSTATVMGMATGYGLDVYQRFVGSLRKSGYQGHIILGVAPDVPQDVLDYFEYRNVMWHKLQLVNCTFETKKPTLCAYPYNDIKTRWSRFPLQRDWLEQCQTCTGPVLVMDVRDSFFQQDPFGPGSPPVQGLFVMEEHPSQKTTHWLTKVPLEQCKGIKLDEIMLCSGTTVGTNVAMIKYLEVMHAEMKLWANDTEHCQFGFHGDDQAIHNYLFYSGQLPFATAWANRAGGIVNTVGKEGSNIKKAHVEHIMKTKNVVKNRASATPFSPPGSPHWLGAEWNMTNQDGWFTEADGSLSRVIHQFDRFGTSIWQWLSTQDLVKDPMPFAGNHSSPKAVYCFEEPPFGRNELCEGLNMSKRLQVTTDPHASEVIWTVGQMPFKQDKGVSFLELLKQSMEQRLQRRNYTKKGNNYTQDLLNQVDPLWKIFVVDGSDQGHGGWFEYFLGSQIAPIVGWKRLHFVTRTTQHSRGMRKFARSPTLTASQPFAKSLGCPMNFTHRLGRSFATVQHLSLNTREDILEALEQDNKDHHLYPRPTDVRTFWNSTICNKICSFRNVISEVVHQLNNNTEVVYNVKTDVVGHVHYAGREKFHPDYIKALMTTKIIVLAQRDAWEGHLRTMEAMLSGALVLEDARTLYYPYGMIDSVNVVLYYSIADLLDKLRYYLHPDNAANRVEIGRQGRALALEHHRLWQRAERILLLEEDQDIAYNEYGVIHATTNNPPSPDLAFPFSERRCSKQKERDGVLPSEKHLGRGHASV